MWRNRFIYCIYCDVRIPNFRREIDVLVPLTPWCAAPKNACSLNPIILMSLECFVHDSATHLPSSSAGSHSLLYICWSNCVLWKMCACVFAAVCLVYPPVSLCLLCLGRIFCLLPMYDCLLHVVWPFRVMCVRVEGFSIVCRERQSRL